MKQSVSILLETELNRGVTTACSKSEKSTELFRLVRTDRFLAVVKMTEQADKDLQQTVAVI